MILGMNNKLYRNTGTFGSPIWVPIGNHKDGKISIKRSEADSSARDGSGWGSDEATLRKLEYTFTMLYDETDSNYSALRASLLAPPPNTVEFAFADGAIATSGTNYIRATCSVFSGEPDQPLEGVTNVEFHLKPSRAANNPSFNMTP